MRHALLQRLGHGLLVLWAAFTLSFVLLQVLPGDAVLIKFQNPDLGLSPAQIEEMRVAYGADSPLWQQYGHTLLAMLRGDFGYSLQAGVPVSELIASNLPDTLSLALPAFVLAVLLAFALAFASRLPGLRWLSNTLQSLPVLFISLPTFWLGIALIQLFSFQLRLIPVINPTPLQGLILPIVTVAIPISAPPRPRLPPTDLASTHRWPIPPRISQSTSAPPSSVRCRRARPATRRSPWSRQPSAITPSPGARQHGGRP
jgi:peptide/nickel transport system permease protein